MKKLFSTFLLTICAIISSASFAYPKKIYIYQDEGVDKTAFHQTANMFNSNFAPDKYIIASISASEIIQGDWTKDAALFVIPGGADLPYCDKLDGAGNKKIKEYVENGGSYLGLCAGGYYGSAEISFHTGGSFYIKGSRELKFFNGKCIGPVLAKYSPDNNIGCRAAELNLSIKDSSEKKATVYYNGGGYFMDADNKENTTVLARYATENNWPAIVHIIYGKGNVILSGVHPEFDPNLLDSNDQYVAKIKPTLLENNQSRKDLNTKLLEILLKKK